MITNIELLQRITERVEKAGVDIAPDYHQYMPMAFGIANACGEAGRAYFHRLCTPSPRYKEADADKLYSNALKSGRKTNSLGTVWYLAEAAGVRLEDLRALDVRLRQVSVPEREYPCGNLPLPSLDDAPAGILGTSPDAPSSPGNFQDFQGERNFQTFSLSPFPSHTHTGARTLYIDNMGNGRGEGKEGGYGPEGGSGRGSGRGPEGFSRRGPEGGSGRGRGPEGGPRSGLGGETEPADEEDWTEKEEEKTPPAFPEYAWPAFIQRGIDCGDGAAQRSCLLLSILTTLGATIADMASFYYGNRRMHPCLQVFIIAPPASGKGVMGWARNLAQPIHEEKLRLYEQQMAIYRTEKMKWDALGKERANEPEPVRPVRKLFFIAGDNTGTGIEENLIDQEGLGMISVSEASILSAAISSDYGNWSSTLRQAFDHDGIAYNRRTNQEHRECKRLLLSVLISGTPGQVRPLIPSAENGLFSRQIFYHLPPIRQWKSQFHASDCDHNALFEHWGERWKLVWDSLRSRLSQLELTLTEEQQSRFDISLSQLFNLGGELYGSSMRSAVARLGINLLRMMCVVGITRVLDSLLMEADEAAIKAVLEHPEAWLLSREGVRPRQGAEAENVKDGVISSFLFTPTDADYEAVMALAEPLYRHIIHALRLMPDEEVRYRPLTKQQQWLQCLPHEFTRKEALEAAESLQIGANSCDTYLRRLTERGTLRRVSEGKYRLADAAEPPKDE